MGHLYVDLKTPPLHENTNGWGAKEVSIFLLSLSTFGMRYAFHSLEFSTMSHSLCVGLQNLTLPLH